MLAARPLHPFLLHSGEVVWPIRKMATQVAMSPCHSKSDEGGSRVGEKWKPVTKKRTLYRDALKGGPQVM